MRFSILASAIALACYSSFQICICKATQSFRFSSESQRLQSEDEIEIENEKYPVLKRCLQAFVVPKLNEQQRVQKWNKASELVLQSGPDILQQAVPPQAAALLEKRDSILSSNNPHPHAGWYALDFAVATIRDVVTDIFDRASSDADDRERSESESWSNVVDLDADDATVLKRLEAHTERRMLEAGAALNFIDAAMRKVGSLRGDEDDAPPSPIILSSRNLEKDLKDILKIFDSNPKVQDFAEKLKVERAAKGAAEAKAQRHAGRRRSTRPRNNRARSKTPVRSNRQESRAPQEHEHQPPQSQSTYRSSASDVVVPGDSFRDWILQNEDEYHTRNQKFNLINLAGAQRQHIEALPEFDQGEDVMYISDTDVMEFDDGLTIEAFASADGRGQMLTIESLPSSPPPEQGRMHYVYTKKLDVKNMFEKIAKAHEQLHHWQQYSFEVRKARDMYFVRKYGLVAFLVPVLTAMLLMHLYVKYVHRPTSWAPVGGVSEPIMP